MAARHYLQLADGSTIEVTDRVDRIEGWELTEKAEEGSVGSGTMWLKDPDMDLDVDGLRNYFVLEDDSEATDDVIFGGFVVDPEVSRGEPNSTHYDPIGRMWALQITDRNGFWNRRVMVGTDCKRPAETDVARMQWLLTTSEAAWMDDASTYLSTASPSNMDKVDYRGQYLNQIVDDCSQHTGKNWWAQLQETGAGRKTAGWYARGATAYSSDLFLSNDPADWTDSEIADGTSLVWPIADQTKLRRDTSRVYTGVYLRYANGTKAIYRRNAAAVAIYGVRDYVADYPNLKTKAKAIARATRLLNDLADPDERITTKVRLPKGKASMLRAGMRVPFKATHLPGYTSSRWMRVLSVTISPVGAGEHYDLDLELQGPGTDAPGLFTGDAFAALLRSTGDYGVGPYFLTEGGAAGGGWFLEPEVGPLSVVQASAPFFSIVTSEPMLVRIELVVQASWVAADGDYITVAPTINGTPIGPSDTATNVGGGFYGPTVSVDIHNVSLAAGDVVSYQLTDSEGYPILNSGGTNSTYLRVGRGSISMNSGAYTWVGP